RREADLDTDFDLQDIVLLNLQRACEATIDLANRALVLLGEPPTADSRDAFHQLFRLRLIEQKPAQRLMRVVGFRNRLVHQYQDIDLDLVRTFLAENFDDLTVFAAAMARRFDAKPPFEANPGT
ncbi:type VII toxin-antitoxin system HepT family RNase toxin, partial [Geminicoccus flavidas]|uniref:type VII toxin-antitoxin system HepT family RNase toxin n=1 Tax=Geminicoccus flavidas TaxID=2506407 RepID=UPI0013597275